MTDWQTLMQHPAVLALGWALVHTLWAGTLLAGGLWLALRVMPDRPTTRYHACAATLGAIPLVTTLALAVHQPWQRGHAGGATDTAEATGDVFKPAQGARVVLPLIAPEELTRDATTPPGAIDSAGVVAETLVLQGGSASVHETAGLSRWLPYAAVLYALGLCMMSLRLLGGWWLTLWLRTRGLVPLPDELARLAECARQRSGVRRPVRFAISARAAVPCVVGVFRPVVLLPAAAATGLTPAQLSSILAHELAHVRRHDVLINLVQVLIETLLFFHPAVWWIGRQLRAERERRCDDDAVVSVGSPLAYADALAAVAGLDAGRPGLCLAATDGGLAGRVRRLLAPSDASQGRSSVWGASLLAVLIAGTALTVVACGDRTRSEEGAVDITDKADAQTTVDPPTVDGDVPSSEPLGPKQARILEIDYQKLRAGDMRYNVVIRPGDIISVPSPNAGFVYMMGSIARPGAYTIPGEQELTLNRLIASAGGFVDRPEPEPGKVWIVDLIRQVNDTDQDIYRASLQGIRDGSEADIYLRTNDVINIHQATMQEVLDFEQPDWVQAQLKQEHPAGVRPILTQEPPRPKLPGLSPITEADLTPTDEPYVMAEGDTVQVSIYELRIPGRDDVQQRRIDQNGYIRLAIVGPVKAAGRTTIQLEEEIARILDEKDIMRDATVKVQMLDARANSYSFLIQTANTGARPGTYIIPKRDFRLIEAITIARGVPERTKYLYVIRNSESRAEPSGKPSDTHPADGVKPAAGALPLDRVRPTDLEEGDSPSHVLPDTQPSSGSGPEFRLREALFIGGPPPRTRKVFTIRGREPDDSAVGD